MTLEELRGWPVESHGVEASLGLLCNTLIRLGPTLKKAQLALAMPIGCRTGVGPATEADTECGVGSLGRMAGWFQARWLSRYLVATPLPWPTFSPPLTAPECADQGYRRRRPRLDRG